MLVSLRPLSRRDPFWPWAKDGIEHGHYLGKWPDPRTSYEVYGIEVEQPEGPDLAGVLVFNRPESTRCGGWYGTLADVANGWAPATSWQVLNLARVWIDPRYQAGGAMCNANFVPGYHDRFGHFRSTLGSTAIRTALAGIGFDYLRRRPPVFLDEPYEIRWLLSYCDPSKHKGTLYRASGAELYRTNERGLQTYRWPLPALTAAEDALVRDASTRSARAIRMRAQRSQARLAL